MDGPVIQQAVDVAVRAGVGMADVLRAVEAVAAAGAVRRRHDLLEPGRALRRAAVRRRPGRRRGSGAITPDLIPDEAAEWLAAAGRADLDRVFLVAPSSTDARLRSTTAACRGFVYAASVMGVTGARGHRQRRRRAAGRPHPGGRAGPRRLRRARGLQRRAGGRGRRLRRRRHRRLGLGPRAARGPRRRRRPGADRGPAPRGVADGHERRMPAGRHPEPDPGRLGARAAAAARLRAVHHRRHRRRRLVTERRWVARGGAPGDVARHRGLGRALRHPRRPALPRDLQPARRTSARAATRCGRSPSGRAASASGARSRWAASAPGSPAGGAASAPGLRRRRRARPAGRPGDRPARQLVQQGAVRRPDRPAVGAADLRVAGRPGRRRADGEPVVAGLFHPTFLYELLWNLGVAALVIWADRRFRLGHGRAFALYVVALRAGPAVDRAAAHRPGGDVLRRPAQRVHLGDRRSAGGGVLRVAARPAAGDPRPGAGRRRRTTPCPPVPTTAGSRRHPAEEPRRRSAPTDPGTSMPSASSRTVSADSPSHTLNIWGRFTLCNLGKTLR